MSAADPEGAAPRKKGWGGRLLIAALVGLGFLALLYQGVQEARQARPVDEGQPAPGLRAERHGGGSLALEDLKGKVVMLDFWATWCPPCVEELPTLVKLAGEYQSRGLILVAADKLESDSRESVAAFLAQRVPPLPPNAAFVFADDPTLERFRVRVLPTLYFIDRQGRISASYTGYSSEDELRTRIEQALAR